MFYDKKYSLVKPERKKILLSNFKGYDETKVSRDLPCDYVDEVYNFAFKNNCLVSPYGVSVMKSQGMEIPDLPPIDGEARLFTTSIADGGKLKTKLVVSHFGGIEFYVDGDVQWSHIDCGERFDVGVNYLYEGEDMLLLSGGGGLKALTSEGLHSVKDGVDVLDMCVHYERIYAVVKGERNSLWFSDDFDPFNWNVSLEEGGYIDFDGSLGNVNAVKSFDNYLYVFCDFGIYRLTAYADQTQFSMKKVYVSGGRIISKSITCCGEYVAFAGEDGIYLFDGYDVSRYSVKTNDLLQDGFDDVSACYAHHKYIISFTNRRGGDFGMFTKQQRNNTMLIFDLTDKSVNLMRGVSLYDLKALGTSQSGRIIGLSDDASSPVELDSSGLYLSSPYQKYWKSGIIDFRRPSQIKVIRNVEYSIDGQITLGILANGERREFILSPRENFQSIYVKADKFVFYIRADNAKENVRPLTLEVDFLK